MNLVKKIILAGSAAVFIMALSACAPEVGSDQWCKKMNDKEKADWTANEATDYAKHCILK